MFAARYSFARFCSLLEEMCQRSTKAEKLLVLDRLWLEVREAAPAYSADAPNEYFPFMRLLLPETDLRRATFHLKESRIARVLVEVLGLAPGSADAIRFQHWKNPSKNDVASTSFSDVVFVVLMKRGHTQTGTATVAEVNAMLDDLCAAAGAAEPTKAAMMRVIRTLGANEVKWLTRMIVKDMHMQLQYQPVLAAFHPAAVETFNSTNDLEFVCRKCTEPSELVVIGGAAAAGSSAPSIFLFQPLKPMLACVVQSAKLLPLLQRSAATMADMAASRNAASVDPSGLLLVEPKFDGDRVHIHVSAPIGDSAKPRIEYWSRNARNFSALYGPRFNAIVQHALGFDEATGRPTRGVTSAILDGELLVYDTTRKRIAPFGKNRTVAFKANRAGGDGEDGAAPAVGVTRPGLPPSAFAGHRFQHGAAAAGGAVAAAAAPGEHRAWAAHPDTNLPPELLATIDSGAYQFLFVAFDLILLNGKVLTHEPLFKRRELMRGAIREFPLRFEIVSSKPVDSVPTVLAELEREIALGREGIMLKQANATYVPGERKMRWQKLKSDYITGMADSLDLVIIGGYHGTKFGSRRISHFLLGAYVNGSGGGCEGPLAPDATFVSVTKVGTGYTDEDLQELNSELDGKWIPGTAAAPIPAWLDGWRPGAGEFPDVWVHPKDSLIMEVVGYDLQATTKFSARWTLRFPRCLHHIRRDKSLADATDLAGLQRILQASRDRALAAAPLAAHYQHRVGGPTSGVVATVVPSAPGLNVGGGNALMMITTVRAAKRARRKTEQQARRDRQQLPQRTVAVVPTTILPPRASDVVGQSLIFSGYEICFLFAAPAQGANHDRVSLERLVLSHGATVASHPQPLTSIILATSPTAQKVLNWIAACTRDQAGMAKRFATLDVVAVEWLFECIAAQQVLPLAPRHMIYTSEALAAKFNATLDAFNDSFYADATAQTMRASLQLASQKFAQQPRDAAFDLLAALNSSDDDDDAHGSLLHQRRRTDPHVEPFFPFDSAARRVVETAAALRLDSAADFFDEAVAPVRRRVVPIAAASSHSRETATVVCGGRRALTKPQRTAILAVVIAGGCVARSIEDATHFVSDDGTIGELQ